MSYRRRGLATSTLLPLCRSSRFLRNLRRDKSGSTKAVGTKNSAVAASPMPSFRGKGARKNRVIFLTGAFNLAAMSGKFSGTRRILLSR